ncbi:MAG TPA: nickel insertion protein, partial [Elusimicrobiota bacterium]|nr:nickel insertion protein [Elusimicrobiota bacterium]
MKIHIDAGSGVAGDMLMGALLDMGLPARQLQSALRRVIPERNWSLRVGTAERQMWPGRTVRVIGDRPYGSPAKMMSAIRRSTLPGPVRESAAQTIERLAEAEKRVHRGATARFDDEGLALLDTLVDVAGVIWGFWRMGFREITASAVVTGRIPPTGARLIED